MRFLEVIILQAFPCNYTRVKNYSKNKSLSKVLSNDTERHFPVLRNGSYHKMREKTEELLMFSFDPLEKILVNKKNNKKKHTKVF